MAQYPHLLSVAAVDISESHTDQIVGPGPDDSAVSIELDRDAYRTQIEATLMHRRQRHMAVRHETIRAAGNKVVQQWMERRASAMADDG